MNYSPDFPYYERSPLFFSQMRFRRQLALAGDNPIPVFKDAIFGTDVHLNDRFSMGEEISCLVRERSAFIDCMLHYVWHRFQWSDDVALVAVGGYGRGELHPKSDIDLMILMSGEHQSDLDNAQALLLLLWDMGLEIGHSVRTFEQCLEIAREDVTVVTNLMESRTVAGNPRLCLELRKQTMPDKMWPMQEFFRAKWEEQKERHRKHSNSEYNLEPNIKNAPGGLRDIQTIGWVAKRHFGVTHLDQLGGTDFFTEEEFAVLISGQEFLWRVRYGLHKLAGRAEERLLFDYQRQLAREFGFQDTDVRLAVEQFMHSYYRVVQALRELNDVLLHYLDDAVVNHNGNAIIVPINERFQLRDNYIEVTHSRVFEETPSALLEIFLHMGQNPDIIGVRPMTIRLLREHRDLIDERFRRDPRNNDTFLQLLKDPVNLATQLRRMKRYNILGRFLPAFGAVIGQMQHDLFHIYTVDHHTLMVIDNIGKLFTDEGREKFSQACVCARAVPEPELLTIAGLFHDIGKGRGGDHSILGARDANEFCLRLGLSESSARLVAWLVEKHLLMSFVSQKRDLADPAVIHEFAREMGNLNRLNYLYALTVADINATNPSLWTTWRASLMRQLYTETARLLRIGLEQPVNQADIVQQTQDNAMRLLLKRGVERDKIEKLWSYLGDDYFLHEHSRDICWQSDAIIHHNSDDDLVLVRETTNNAHEGATEIFIRTKDRRNVFVAVASALDQLNLSIQDARIYNTDRGGYAIDTFYVLDHNNLPIGDNPHKVREIEQTLKQALKSVDTDPEAIKRLTPRQLKSFPIATQTNISNELRNNVTILEVITPDRPGLLASIARIFYEHGIQVYSAKIATLGERVEDIFYIVDSEGRPLSDPQFCAQLQNEIRTRIDQQVVGGDNFSS